MEHWVQRAMRLQAGDGGPGASEVGTECPVLVLAAVFFCLPWMDSKPWSSSFCCRLCR